MTAQRLAGVLVILGILLALVASVVFPGDYYRAKSDESATGDSRCQRVSLARNQLSVDRCHRGDGVRSGAHCPAQPRLALLH